MDPKKKATLEFIEQQVHRLSRGDRGRQLLMVTEDFVLDQDLLEARRVLRSIDVLYFTHDLPAQIAQEPDVARALAACVEVFGVELEYLRRPAGEA